VLLGWSFVPVKEYRVEFRPLVELMFRGTLWLQHNGSD